MQFDTNTLITAGEYFLFISAELLVLFVAISFLVALLQEFVPKETVQRVLSKPQKWLGNILGAVLGAATPFCSCSTIPILAGLLDSGAPFGASMSFLVASPLLNPVILSLFLAMMGWKVTVIYTAFTFVSAVLIGAAWERLGLAGDHKTARLQMAGCCACDCASQGMIEILSPLTRKEKFRRAGSQTWTLFRQVLPYLLIGAGIGSFIYGFVPEEFIARVAGPDNPLAIPVAAAIGVPMYIRVETMIPIASVFMAKGMSLGAVMALIIGGAGASIPEITLLASIFKPRLVAVFTLTILAVAAVSGYVFQVLQTAL